jgi:hypothetical protein
MMSIFTCITLTIFLFIYGFIAGKCKLFPYAFLSRLARIIKSIIKQEPKALIMEGYSDTSNKIQVDCTAIDRNKTMVILALGQGNAANGGEGKYTPKHNVYNIFNGKCYKADDPLLGATDNKGSVWGRLGDKIIENGMYENVIIKSIGVGGSPVICWTVSGTGIGYKDRLYGNYHSRILEANEELTSLGFPITHILWHQGESDMKNGTTTAQYKERFLDMLGSMRKNGIGAPIYVALASRYGRETSQEVINAQKQLVEEHVDIFQGPNTDIIDRLEERTEDGQRFTEIGLEKHANAWVESLKQYNEHS